LFSNIFEGQPTLFKIIFLGVEKEIKQRKCQEKQEKVVKGGKFLAFYRNISVNFPFFRKFLNFSYFSTRFLAFIRPRKLVKKESVAPRLYSYLDLSSEVVESGNRQLQFSSFRLNHRAF